MIPHTIPSVSPRVCHESGKLAYVFSTTQFLCDLFHLFGKLIVQSI